MEVRPGIKFIVTVSPVPLDATFSGVDIAIANSASKSTLRMVAQKFCDCHPNADYFPSYEMVTCSDPSVAFAPDRRHVARPDMVDRITDLFCESYLAAPR